MAGGTLNAGLGMTRTPFICHQVPTYDPANRGRSLPVVELAVQEEGMEDDMEEVPYILGDDEEELEEMEEIPNIEGDVHPESGDDEEEMEEIPNSEGEDVSESAFEEENIAVFFANEANIAANKAAKAAHDAGSSQHKAANTRIREFVL
jgi:hypothetical protein